MRELANQLFSQKLLELLDTPLERETLTQFARFVNFLLREVGSVGVPLIERIGSGSFRRWWIALSARD